MDGGKKRNDPTALDGFLAAVRFRMDLYLRSRAVCRAALAASVPAFLMIAASRVVWFPFAPAAAFALLAAAVVAAAALKRGPSRFSAALLADLRLGLSELLPTACEVPVGSPGFAFLKARAAQRIAAARPSEIASFRVPPEALALIGISVAMALFCALTEPVVQLSVEAQIADQSRARRARELGELAASMEERFGASSAPVAERLREMARMLEDQAESFTKAGSAISRMSESWKGESASLEEAERALENVLSAAGGPTGDGGFELPASAAARESARAALSDILSSSSTSDAHGAAARGAIEALDSGAAPAFAENLARLQADLARTRRARMIIEAALRKAEAAAESAAASGSSPTRGAPVESGAGGQAKAKTPPAGARESTGDPAQAQWGAVDMDWNPRYDEVVKKYFGSDRPIAPITRSR